MPICPLKSAYDPPQAPVISEFCTALIPEKVKLLFHNNLPSSPSNAYTLLLTVATNSTLCACPLIERLPTTNGWEYIWSSTGSVMRRPKCVVFTFVVFSSVSLLFHPVLKLSPCWVV